MMIMSLLCLKLLWSQGQKAQHREWGWWYGHSAVWWQVAATLVMSPAQQVQIRRRVQSLCPTLEINVTLCVSRCFNRNKQIQKEPSVVSPSLQIEVWMFNLPLQTPPTSSSACTLSPRCSCSDSISGPGASLPSLSSTPPGPGSKAVRVRMRVSLTGCSSTSPSQSLLLCCPLTYRPRVQCMCVRLLSQRALVWDAFE